jgi:hypothetical protein
VEKGVPKRFVASEKVRDRRKYGEMALEEGDSRWPPSEREVSPMTFRILFDGPFRQERLRSLRDKGKRGGGCGAE